MAARAAPRGRARARLALALLLVAVPIAAARAADLRAGPADYRDVVRRLAPGDRLQLAPGTYEHGLDLHGLAGQDGQWISIEGAAGPQRSVFVASPRRNTVSIVDAAYVRLARIDLVARGVPVDAVKAEGHAHFAHHIVLEGLRISGYDRSQQNVGISTKCPAWGWVIRDNRIERVGTGLYLGDSDGSAPFVRGVVEGNQVAATLGYSMQIKHQATWPESMAVEDGAGATIIRYNTFSKEARSSTGDAARPNLLLGHWPRAGRGADDRYLVYGNRFIDNPAEFLLQAEGNVVVYNNLFVNRQGGAVALREHNDVPRRVDVFHNTILAQGTGLMLRNADPASRQTLTDNTIYAERVVPSSLARENAVLPYAHAVFEAGRVRPVSAIVARRSAAATRDAPLSRERAALPDVDLDVERRPRASRERGARAAGSDPARAR